jgi:hypothetical protein
LIELPHALTIAKEATMLGAIRVLNELEALGLYSKWALGGAMGLTFYLEATQTDDVDVLVMIPPVPGQLLVNLGPLHEALRARGCTFEGEHVVIAGILVQFIDVAPGSLEAEALDQAIERDMKGERLRIAPLEHLLAIAIRLQRGKDKVRLAKTFSETPEKVDFPRLTDILTRHGLLNRYDEFRRLYG